MGHNLTTVLIGGEQKTAFIYNTLTVGVPWHGLGDPHNGEFFLKEGVRQIGADFRAVGDAVYRQDGTRIPGWKEIRHPAGMTYAVKTDDYEIVDYVDLVDALSVAAGEDENTPRGNTMGMLGDDAGGFFCSTESTFAKINKKNEIKRFIVFYTGHDGRGNRLFGTDVNPVCQNTINAGLRLAEKQKDNFVMLPHKKGVGERIKTMARMIAMTQEIEATKLEAYVALAERNVTRQEVEDYTVQLFPWDKDLNGPTPERVLSKRISVEMAFAHPTVAGKPTGSDAKSAYGLLNAATWWIDHEQAKENWSRTMFSPACQDTRQRAFDLALELVPA